MNLGLIILLLIPQMTIDEAWEEITTQYPPMSKVSDEAIQAFNKWADDPTNFQEYTNIAKYYYDNYYWVNIIKYGDPYSLQELAHISKECYNKMNDSLRRRTEDDAVYYLAIRETYGYDSAQVHLPPLPEDWIRELLWATDHGYDLKIMSLEGTDTFLVYPVWKRDSAETE